MTNTYEQGRLDGIRASGWTCGDCGNEYDATVEGCPNTLLDNALAAVPLSEKATPRGGSHQNYGYLAPERTPEGKAIVVGPFGSRQEAEEKANGNPIVTMPGVSAGLTEPERDSRHLGNCPCEFGSCCSWIENCDCQCMCDLIALVEERVRAECAAGEDLSTVQ